MTRIVDVQDFTILSGTQFSNELSVALRDAYKIIVTPPAVLAEADVTMQIWDGAEWSFYDATNFVAGIDNYKEFDPKGLKYRLTRRAGNVAADRLFRVIKRVAGDG